jgi:Mce-associated membrane protein
MAATDTATQKAARRRAVRAAGPTSEGTPETTRVRFEKPRSESDSPRPHTRKASRPPNRAPHRRLVAICAAVFAVIAFAGVGSAVAVIYVQNRHAEAVQQRDQRLVDTASQLAVNMYSFNQNTVEDSVKRVLDSTSGPLHDMLSRDNHPEVLKQFFRSMGGSSEAVVSGAALEQLDQIDKQTYDASVLVSVRVTTTDMNGNMQPSKPSRMRVVVRDEDGMMTARDLKWPDGGN